MKFKMAATAGLSLTLDPMGKIACIVHLVIKKTNWFYVKTMSCSGSHLGITININGSNHINKHIQACTNDNLGVYCQDSIL
jgi:hypothetical protein